MKKCNTCGETKAIEDFPLTQGKRRAQCKLCRVAMQRKRKAERVAELKAIAEAEAAARKEAYLNRENVALPRTFTFTETYVPDSNFYQRNNGNKHIQSRGV